MKTMMRLGSEYVREGGKLVKKVVSRPITKDMVLFTCGFCERMTRKKMSPLGAVLTYINPDTEKTYEFDDAQKVVLALGFSDKDCSAATYERLLGETEQVQITLRMEENDSQIS